MEDEANEFSGYDAGWRLGTFDKCNGKGFRHRFDDGYPETPFNIGFFAGYGDAYNSNERRI